MNFTPKKLNTFLMVKLPSAWLCGVRVQTIDTNSCTVNVRHKWINKNPFKSMFWAVQGMAAEMSTGTLVMKEMYESKKKISMLVASNKATFTKKAVGKITFTTNDGVKIKKAIEDTIRTGEGQTFWMESIGVDEVGDVVSNFAFEWTIKVKS
ncbi:thioesterase [Neptunitalea chrysea]|uniref:Thioesterase n=1 Tax=Neptunitalea chrysea TaxID=1647581 RepID=A0A9W6B4D4_9FLAO|nr:DUF4442 domain-containing protein [Neptunitalea chrysea]GLB51617.1 thioesterase [Neptunitalea chrysea]